MNRPRATSSLVLLFVGLQLGMVVSTMDGTIVATALPTIADDLGGTGRISWVVTSYLLAQVAVMPIYGKVGDVLGRKRVLFLALSLFALGSALCGLAQSMDQLCAARFLQGLGAGGIGPLAMAILADLVPARQLGRWLGYQGAIFVAAGVAGPLVGGLFVDHLSWRWAFYVNLPLIAVSMLIVGTRLRIPYRRIPHSIDVAGSLLLTGALASLVLLASEGGKEFGWTSGAVVALGALAVGFGAAFYLRERSAPEPFVPLRLFRNRVVRVADALNLTSGMLFFCGIFFLPQFLQKVGGVSATESGLLLIPFMVATAGTTLVSGRMVERTGRYKIWPVIGAVCMTAGVGLLATIGIDTPVAVATAFAAVLGAGVGFTMQPSLLALQNGADREDLGIATSTALLGRTLGGTIAVPIFATILRTGLDGGTSAADYAHALPMVFLAAVPLGIIAFFVSLRLEERPLREDAHYALAAEAAP